MPGGNKMPYILTQTCSLFVAGLLKYAWSFITTRHGLVNDLQWHHWCRASFTSNEWVWLPTKVPSGSYSRRGHYCWFWGILSSHLRYAGYLQPALLKQYLQILAKLYQLRTICKKGIYRNKWCFYNQSKMF